MLKLIHLNKQLRHLALILIIRDPFLKLLNLFVNCLKLLLNLFHMTLVTLHKLILLLFEHIVDLLLQVVGQRVDAGEGLGDLLDN